MPLKGVLQSRWMKGLNAAFGIFSQPPNSLPRISNLLMTRLGALKTTPGSRIVSSFANQGPLLWNPLTSGMWKEIFYYNPASDPPRAGYYGLREEPTSRLPGIVGSPSAAVVSVPGAVPFPGIEFAVTVADGVGGETPLSGPVTVTTAANQGIKLTFTYVRNAAGYNIYMLNAGVWQRLIPQGATTSFTSITVINNFPNWQANTSYVIGNQIIVPIGNLGRFLFIATQAGTSGSAGPNWPQVTGATVTDGTVIWENTNTVTFTLANIPQANLPPGSIVVGVKLGTTTPPAVNTTQALEFLSIPVGGTGWTAANRLWSFPADLLPNPGGGGSGQRGGGSTPSGGGGPAGTASGGVLGVASVIPMIIQFADKMFLALGNGLPPYESLGIHAQPVFNTFQGTYPDWQTGIGYIVGDQIVPLTGNANFSIFTATQGGISGGTGGAAPAWPQNVDSQVADGQVIWKNTGINTSPPPPRGAAHVEVYAGSLWVANTQPVFSPQFPADGPSAVWMSDANNPNSWNPLNTAQVARDDGTEIMGIKAFSIAEAGIPTTQQLVCFKNFTTYVINGVFGAADFSIQQAETDQGCIAPRTIQFVPGFGLMRLTHLGFSYFDGIRDRLVSTDLHPYLFGDPNQPDIQPIDWAFAYFSKGAQVSDPPMYICACPVLGPNSDLLGTIPPCPLPGSNSDLLGQIPASEFTVLASATFPGGNIPPLFPPGQYYFRITLRGPLLETAITPEIGPITAPASGTGPSLFYVQSSLPLPNGYTGWRIYWGANGPGSESNYQDTGPELYSPTGVATILEYPGLPTTGAPVGLSGTLTRIFCYDLTLKSWTIVDLPFSISVLRQFRIMGQVPVVISGGFWDGTVRRLFSHAPDWDGVSICWSLQTTEVYNQGGDQRIFFRRLRIRGSGNGPISVTPNRDGFDDETLPAVFWALGGDQFMAEGAIMAEAVNCHATVSGQGQVVIDSLDFHAVPKPVGAGVVIS